ncbi:MAG: SUMF1/EgtB/PvdO family nonheme iron enzyme [Nitrospira sp.]|nr:SUMF1/EgtB/PvdO family nonheme iron enzyme [Nitrospira sp.]
MRSRIPGLTVLSILLLVLVQLPARSAAEQSPTQGKNWAVVIGINDYQNVKPLQYAIKDAMAVGDLLAQQGFAVTRLVSPTATTRQSIERVLGTQLPKQLGADDRVLIFFSGHGKDEQFGAGQRHGYLLPIEANPQDLSSTAISMSRVQEWANAWPAKHVLFIVDSCYSGIIGLNTKGIDPEGSNPMTEMYLKQITKEPSRQLIVAGQANQEALEIAKWEQSLLTHFLLEGLSKGTADGNADGIILTSELYQFLAERVIKEAVLNGSLQHPQHWSLSADKGEFVFILPGQGRQAKPVQPVRIPTPSFSAVPSPAMVRIAPGSFMRRAESVLTLKGWSPPGPWHKVHITQPFAIARYETTFDEYDRFARATGRPLPDDENLGRGSRPVVTVSWNDAQAYAQWLSQQTGKRYRLPTEAEWEYAARSGGQDQTWAGTSEESQLKKYAVYEANKTEPVGSKQPNGLGLYDMSGNVWEWVEDCQHWDYEGAPSDGSAWLATNGGDCNRRAIRGGAWDNIPVGLRTSSRNWSLTDYRFNFLGFRLVQDLP